MSNVPIPINYKRPNNSHSALESFLRCKKYYLLNSLYKPLIPKKPLVVGSAIHAGLEEFYLTKNADSSIAAIIKDVKKVNIQDEITEAEYTDETINLLLPYMENYAQDDLEVLVAETKFNLELAPGIMFKGKIDGIVKYEGEYMLLEHKSSGWTANKLFPTFEDRNRQLETYIWASQKTFGDTMPLEKALVNVIFKGNTRKVTSFERKAFLVGESRIDTWVKETIAIINDINYCYDAMESSGNQEAFYCNRSSCHDFNTECEHLGFCDTGDAACIKYSHVEKDFSKIKK